MSMRIATQNINWGGEPTAPACDGTPRLSRLIPWLGSLEADLLVLTEVKVGPLGDELSTLLAAFDYRLLFAQKLAGRRLGTAIATRRHVELVDLPILQAGSNPEPWRAVGVGLGGVSVFGFYFPFGDGKPEYWEWLLANARELRGQNVLLVGDFNTGKGKIDEAGDTFECQHHHVALEALGFVDTWRATHHEDRDYTWHSSSGNGFRLDYIWASPSLADRVEMVSLEHEPRLARMSDHSAVVINLKDRGGHG